MIRWILWVALLFAASATLDPGSVWGMMFIAVWTPVTVIAGLITLVRLLLGAGGRARPRPAEPGAVVSQFGRAPAPPRKEANSGK